jgi:hypothetical protein
MKTVRNWLCAVLLLTFPAIPLDAAQPRTLHYQGYLTTSAGAPFNGAAEVTFRLYTAPTGGVPLWEEQIAIYATNGHFQVILGNSTQLDLPFDEPYWLALRVGLDGEMTPRQPLAAAPYAMRAATLESTATIQGSQVSGTISGATISGATLTQLQTQFSPAVSFAPPQSNTHTPIPGIGGVGGGTSITVGNDGLPVITFWDNNASLLRVIKCSTPSCSTSSTVTADTAGGSSSSIAIGTDGLPVISYRDNSGNLKAVKCSDSACAGSKTVTTVDGTGPNAFSTSIGIALDGLPVIAYHDSTNNRVKVAKCNDAACQTPATLTPVTANATGGHFLSMAIGVDGLPVIAYWSQTFQTLNVLKCPNPACTGTVTPNPVTTIGFGEFTSIAIGADGLPMIAFTDSGRLRVAKCSALDCSGGAGLTFLTVITSNSGYRPALAIGADGLPVIAFQDNSSGNGDLKVAKCSTTGCGGGPATTTMLAADGHVGFDISIAIGADGLPVITYHDNTTFQQKVVKCANAFCAPFFRRR